ncbi:DUF2089 domain-containing protein [Mycoplasmatota bacterium WC44]
MKNQIVGNCPVCNDLLYVTELECESCSTKIKGEFYLSKFSYLTKEQLYFVEVFIKNKGNIKAIEKEMSISYPTVKKSLDDVVAALGYDVGNNKMEILARLESGEITPQEATELLKK